MRVRSSYALLALLTAGCGTTPNAAVDGGGDASDGGIVDASTVAWRLTPGVGSIRMIESQSTDGIVLSGLGTDWAGDAAAPFTVELNGQADAAVVWSLRALTRSAGTDPSGWHLVGSAGTEATFPSKAPPASESEFLAMTNFGPNTISVLYLPPLGSGNVELDGIASENDWVWVRGASASATVDLGSGPTDAGEVDGGPLTNFVARYFGATTFSGVTFLPARVTAIAPAPFGIWGGASDTTGLHLFTITEANVFSELRAFAATSSDGRSASFDYLVGAPPTGDASSGDVIGSFLNWPTVAIDFGLQPAGTGGSRIVRFDGAGTPLWTTTLGDPPTALDSNIKRRVRVYCRGLGATGCVGEEIAALGTDQGVSALFLLDANGALIKTWHADAGDVILDFDLVGGTTVVGTSGSTALIERITNFP